MLMQEQSDVVGLEDVIAFLEREADLADGHQYDEWEALWCDDGIYWIPSGADDIDPETQVSYIYDNRRRLRTRIAQLKTGLRYVQMPASRLSRIIGNVRIANTTRAQADVLDVHSKFLLAEYRLGATTLWAGRLHHRLRPTADGLRIVQKKVMLLNNGGDLPSFGFLL
jgi:benzoate/toluate 1,2-dioxygenase beta subunit